MEKPEEKEVKKMTIDEIKKLVNEADEASQDVRDRIKVDINFSSSVGDQWLDEDVQVRGESRAKFQFPLIPTYISRIVGGYSANPFSIKLEAIDSTSQADVDKLQAKIMEIEQNSGGKNLYQSVLANSVACGYGYLVITTDIDKDENEVIEIQPIRNPLSILFDPMSQCIDGSDAEYAIHQEDISKEKAKRLYPDFDEAEVDGILWNSRTDSSVPIITLWKINEKGTVDVVKTVGNKIVHQATLEIDRIPVIPVHGETVLQTSSGSVEYVGITHRAIDASRLLNYVGSLSAERLALSPKANYLVEASSITEHQKIWSQANVMNFPALPYDAFDKQNRQLPAPIKQDTSVDIGDITNLNGLYSDSVANIIGIPLEGIVENHSIKTAEETITRQRNSESVLAVYYENLASSIKSIGEVLIQLIPQVYDGMNTLKNVKLDVSSGPLLATLRKEKLRHYISISSLLPEYKVILAPKMLECMDGADEELVEQAKAVSVMLLKQMVNQTENGAQNQEPGMELQQSPEMQNLMNEKIALQNQVADLTGKLEQVGTQWSEAKAKLEAEVLMENLKHQHAMELEALRQQGQNTRQTEKLVADAEKTTFEAQAKLDQTIAENDQNLGIPPEMI